MTQFQQIRELLADDLSLMNKVISDTLATDNRLMNTIVTGYLETKGKQIRPMMVILAAKMLGEVNPGVIHAGAALEMLHNASLIHDDIVDETSVRRGLPTINASWDNHIAVLVGDFFVSKALEAGIATGNIAIVGALSNLGEELSLGEIDQICNVREQHFDDESYFDMIRKKTASLFRNCVKVGAEAAGIAPEVYAPLMQYAELLGMCFQIKDDIFDYYSQEKVGKPTGNDLRERKVTLPLLYALQHSADHNATSRMREEIVHGDLDDDTIHHLIEFAKAEGGIDHAYSVMRDMQQQADRILTEHYPDSRWRQAFRDIFEFIIARDY